MTPSCPTPIQAAPVSLVVFGATGDLAMRKIYPALASLCKNGLLSHDSRILAVGRKNLDTPQYANLLSEMLGKTIPESCMADLIPRVRYLRLDPDAPESGYTLSLALGELDAGKPRNRRASSGVQSTETLIFTPISTQLQGCQADTRTSQSPSAQAESKRDGIFAGDIHAVRTRCVFALLSGTNLIASG